MMMTGLLATLFLSQINQAADGPECFSEQIRYNVCEKARELQRQAAKILPMAINQNVTLSAVVAAGPELTFVGIWQMNKADVDQQIRAAGLSMFDLASRASTLSTNMVCSQPALAAFVRLKGRIQYSYKTLDGYSLFSPAVSDCPR